MKWMIGIFVVLFVGLKLALPQTPRPIPVINLDANAHTIEARVNCVDDRVTTIDIYVDGRYLMTTTNPPAPPTGFGIQ